ncbi:unnamed protein product [Spirodela intermedia]|uniref:Uncharacterized protein n=1 Tax=Spirodela intermedia TaxID=51605 RepID=A0A7I8JM82_SPIIN|nr:unnamed protein product [Spirodela intermedia]CAA6670572.1 unnamed protein product [Spirodela intermedia]
MHATHKRSLKFLFENLCYFNRRSCS